MKFQIERGIQSRLLKERVPTEYKSLASACESKLPNVCTLITFPHNRKDVVKCSLVEKALRKLQKETSETLVVLGGCFSLESVEMLKLQNAVFLSLSEFPWTDERHISIKSGEPR